MFDVRPFKPDDIGHIKPRPGDEHTLGLFIGGVGAWVLFAQFPSCTLMRDDVVLLCCGVLKLFPQMGEVWAVVSQDAAQYPVTVVRMLKRLLIEECSDMTRLQTTVRHGATASERLMKLLGFEPQDCWQCGAPQLLRNYGPDGATYQLYEKLA